MFRSVDNDMGISKLKRDSKQGQLTEFGGVFRCSFHSFFDSVLVFIRRSFGAAVLEVFQEPSR